MCSVLVLGPKTTILYLGLFNFIVGTVGIDQETRESGYSICSSYGYTLIEGKFGAEKHLLCLKMEPIETSPLSASGTTLLLDPEEEYGGLRQAPSLEGATLAFGFSVLEPHAGSAEGYVGADHEFYGVLHLGNRTLHADPYGRDDLRRSFGAFDNDNVLAPLRRRRYHKPLPYHEQFHIAYGRDSFPYHIEHQLRSPDAARARVCDLLLLADKAFYEHDANASLDHVVSRMMHAVAQADIIFRNADFNEDGIPDNIGFSVKYILVLTSNETNSRVFGDLPNERVIDGRNYLMRFARLRRLSEVCLGVAFSGHAFHNRTLGLSFTSLGGGMSGAAGGLCDRRAYGRSFNTLAIAHATAGDNARVPERIAALTLAHEFGHSFGAHHDDNFPNAECRGFLMGAQSPLAHSATHFEFSVCSKRLIAATLSSMSYCLWEQEGPYCGNGIVEEGEACDCGLPSRCAQRDPCCTPRAGGALPREGGALHKGGCEVAPTALCHPSQGPCCNQECQYANLSKQGIDCKGMGVECTCGTPECRCGFGGRCWRDLTCHASECVALGLRECQCEPKGMGGMLAQEGRCGVCCLLPDEAKGRCLAAEMAARKLANNRTIPDLWIDKDYIGPNLTIPLCRKDRNCTMIAIRAWRYNEYCVTRNMLGVCSGRGVCQPAQHKPRSNIYPHIMLSKLVTPTDEKTSATSRKRVLISTMLISYFTIFIF